MTREAPETWTQYFYDSWVNSSLKFSNEITEDDAKCAVNNLVKQYPKPRSEDSLANFITSHFDFTFSCHRKELSDPGSRFADTYGDEIVDNETVDNNTSSEKKSNILIIIIVVLAVIIIFGLLLFLFSGSKKKENS